MRKMSDAEKKKYEESNRLLSAYKKSKQEWFNVTLSLCPEEMIKILRYVRQMPVSAEDDFLDRMQKIDWLMQSHADVKLLLLRVIARRMDDLHGELDDPLPPNTNMFFKARSILGVR